MTKSEKILLQLVAKAINEDYCLNLADFKKFNWVEVIDIASAQGVLAIAFDAIESLPHSTGSGQAPEYRLDMDTLMDWLLFVRKHHESIDWNSLYKALDEFGLRRLAGIFSSIGVKFLGFSNSLFVEFEKDERLVDRVLNDILSPEFTEHEDGTLLSGLWIKPRRFGTIDGSIGCVTAIALCRGFSGLRMQRC